MDRAVRIPGVSQLSNWKDVNSVLALCICRQIYSTRSAAVRSKNMQNLNMR